MQWMLVMCAKVIRLQLTTSWQLQYYKYVEFYLCHGT